MSGAVGRLPGTWAPLAGRVCPWLIDDPVAVEEPDDAVVRAMPLVLRIERDAPSGCSPVRPTALLEAAAAAALAVCLDERAAPATARDADEAEDGPWAEAMAAWVGAGRIRKLARRARTAHWRAVGALDGLTVERGGAEVRALVPGPVDDVAHEVRRLQIGGTDLPADAPGPPDPGRPVIWLNPEVAQSTGKAAAQVGHASMILAVTLAAAGADPAVALDAAVRTAPSAGWRALGDALARDPSGRAAWEEHGVVAVRDAGFTEVAPGTVTCLAQTAAGRAR